MYIEYLFQLIGFWYGNEIMIHRGDKNNELDRNSCVMIDLAEITDSVHHMYNPSQRPNFRYLKLIWNDGNNDYEHILLYNQTNPGVWISKTTPASANSNSFSVNFIKFITFYSFPIIFNCIILATVTKQNFGQFTGVIQVIKTVGNHMVLTFCEKDGRLFSIALTRSSNQITADVRILSHFI